MQRNRAIFLGIDPCLAHAEPGTPGAKPRRAFVYAALTAEGELAALGEGSPEDVLAFAGGQEQAVVAVNAPRRPNQALMSDPVVRARLNPPPRDGRWLDFRVAEYELRQRQVSVPPTPGREEDCPAWMRSVFQLCARLESFGYCPYPSEDAPLQLLEINAQASYTALLGQAPFPKNSLEGRLQRQLVLHQQRLRIPDPMDFFEELTPHRLLRGNLPLKSVYTPQELDALVAAFTALKASTSPEEIILLGDAREGQVVLLGADYPNRIT